MQEQISHKGTIISIGTDEVCVEIISQSACSACKAAALCGASESEKKIIRVPARPGETLSVGQEVEVCLAQRQGMKAVLLSYVIPVMILLILILSLSQIGIGELASGLVSIGGVGIYYLILFLLRKHLAEGYEFYIRK